ncbi:hypothetical protein Pmani_019073 [Petrolisthes manimaculis]|uniref:C2H2-type domain-containing protein n=1 Tax=Petrolisthes manimaculis TaxID=1843537 RepID=A0AAE1PL65_9EUCA|nr:hypothetical protein Pmani_026160 [Petrolisthes manimaculis]KAK4309284.1 hypothetical protein Pmani_019073 [Petrolisthes manimaculis]
MREEIIRTMYQTSHHNTTFIFYFGSYFRILLNFSTSEELPYTRMSRKKWKLSKEEAKGMLEEEVRDKDFWAVHDDYNNFDQLQGVLDALFNTIEGNKYKVAYQENQKGTRLQIRCGICSKDLNSFDPFISHENGKNHKKMRQQQVVPKDPNLHRKLEKQLHNEPRGIFTEGSLEDMIDNTTLLVIGVQFLYKEVVEGQETFSCQLCCLDRISAERMFSHLTNVAHNCHNAKYLEVKYGVKKMRGELEEYGRIVEEREGKIHTSIVDFTKQLQLPAIHERHRNQISRPSSSTHSRRNWSPSTPNLKRTRSPSKSRSRSRSLSPKDDWFPLLPPKPSTSEKGVTVDLKENARPIMIELGMLEDLECLETVQEDGDMQGLLIQTLWVLSEKMKKYYLTSRSIYGRESGLLEESTKKVQNYISRLSIINNDNGE